MVSYFFYRTPSQEHLPLKLTNCAAKTIVIGGFSDLAITKEYDTPAATQTVVSHD